MSDLTPPDPPFQLKASSVVCLSTALTVLHCDQVRQATSTSNRPATPRLRKTMWKTEVAPGLNRVPLLIGENRSEPVHHRSGFLPANAIAALDRNRLALSFGGPWPRTFNHPGFYGEGLGKERTLGAMEQRSHREAVELILTQVTA